jgi:UDP-N-acetylmuramoyl-tripeptide--D-alanyl-D-alanine ligase
MKEALLSALGTKLALGDVKDATAGKIVSGRGEKIVTGVSIDSRTLAAGDLFVAIAGPRFDGHDFLSEAASRGAAAALVHKDVTLGGLDLVRVEDTTRALGDLATHVRRSAGIPVVGITGSTGKTTTKEMTSTLLGSSVLKTEGNLNNKFGLPLTLLRLRSEHRFAVLELGMSAPGEIRALSAIARPDIAVITNVAPVHLEFFSSIDEIASAKAEILEDLGQTGAAVLNGDDRRVWRIGEHHPGKVIFFGRDRAWEVSAENVRGGSFGMRFDLRIAGERLDVAIPMAGPHFVMNFLAAAAVAWKLGVDPKTIAERASALRASPHRGEVLRLGDRVTLIDDSYNSNPLAVEAAVQALSLAEGPRRVAFLGDMLELGPRGPALHFQTGERIADLLDVLVAVGPLAGEFLKGARAKEALAFPDAPSAAAAAGTIVKAADAVLVKGSRGVRMESIVEALVARFGLDEARREA